MTARGGREGSAGGWAVARPGRGRRCGGPAMRRAHARLRGPAVTLRALPAAAARAARGAIRPTVARWGGLAGRVDARERRAATRGAGSRAGARDLRRRGLRVRRLGSPVSAHGRTGPSAGRDGRAGSAARVGSVRSWRRGLGVLDRPRVDPHRAASAGASRSAVARGARRGGRWPRWRGGAARGATRHRTPGPSGGRADGLGGLMADLAARLRPRPPPPCSWRAAASRTRIPRRVWRAARTPASAAPTPPAAPPSTQRSKRRSTWLGRRVRWGGGEEQRSLPPKVKSRASSRPAPAAAHGRARSRRDHPATVFVHTAVASAARSARRQPATATAPRPRPPPPHPPPSPTPGPIARAHEGRQLEDEGDGRQPILKRSILKENTGRRCTDVESTPPPGAPVCAITG